MQITYTNKEALQNDPEVAEKNKVTADNMNEIKTVVNTNEEELSAYISDLENNQLTGQSSGTSIDLSDSADSRVRSIGLSGNSEQESTTGKSKFNIFDLIKMSNSYSNYKNGYSFEPIGTMYNIGVTLEKPIQLPVSFSYKIKNETGTNFRLIFEFDNGTSMNLIQYGSGTGTNERTITANNITQSGATTITKIKGDYSDSGRFTIYDFIINEGTTATSYEPYTGGIASPNPSYPQDIHSTGDSGSVNEKVQNKNLLELQDVAQTTALGLHYNVKDGEITIDGTSNSSGGIEIPLKSPIACESGINYTFSKKYSGTYSNNNFNIQLRSNGRNIKNPTAQALPITYNDLSDTIDAIRLYIGSGFVFNNYTLKLQLEQGTTATDYVAHEEQNISIPCQQPMRAIGEYKDTFVKVDGNWYERHYIGQVLLDGTENWLTSGVANVFYIDSITNYATSNNIPFSNCYKGVSNVSGASGMNTQNNYTTAFINISGSTTPRFYIKDNRFTSVSELKTWLSNNNVELIYVLETPVDLPCTEEQIEALESLEKARTYKPVTHISSEDVVPATIDLTYVKDLETVINNLGGA